MTNQLTIPDLNVQDVAISGPALDIGELSEEQFTELGHKLRTIEGFSQFWLGDWANAIVAQYSHGTLKEQCIKAGLDYGTVKTYAWVAKTYEKSSRLDLLKEKKFLTFEHFREAARAPAPEFELKQLEAGTTRNELRAKISTAKAARKAATTIDEKGDTLFQWIRDPRVIAAEEAFLSIQSCIAALRQSDEDTAMRDIILKKMKARAVDLVERMKDV